VPLSSLFLGIACIACGLCAAKILNQMKYWPFIISVGILMAGIQFGMAAFGLTPLAALVAGLSGILITVFIYSRRSPRTPYTFSTSLKSTFFSYGSLIFILSVIYLAKPIYQLFFPVSWQMQFPGTITNTGFIASPGSGQAYRFFLHPGIYMALVGLTSYWFLAKNGLSDETRLKTAALNTLKSAGPASIGIIATMGLSGFMDQCGMTLMIAKGISALMGNTFPIVSPFIGMLGAFATGSNNNSNVLFAPLQKSVAELLSINPLLLIATQTTGGSLGSMLAPAKIIVGCSTVGIVGKEGEALKKAIPFGLIIGFIIGGIAFLISKTY
jgi:lactate permease